MRNHALRLVSALAACLLGLTIAGSAAAATTVGGPDVSGWQHPNGYTIDWKATKVAGGAQFAFVKATEGTGYVNKYFKPDFAALAAEKLVRGAYHFARPTTAAGDAAAQARHFVSAVGKLGARGDLPPVLDIEVSGGLGTTALVAWTKAYLAEVEKLTGRTPMIYTYPAFWKASMGNTTAFTKYPLWIATWGPKPVLVGGWTRYTFWQYTDKATVPGMAGPVDMNVFNGTVSQLRTFANDAPLPPAPPAVKPSAPTAFAATPGTGSVTLTWSAPKTTGGALIGYDLTVDGGTPVRLPATTTSHTVTGLAGGTAHTFAVAAVNTVGTGTPVEVSATPRVPVVPAQVALTPAAATVPAGSAHTVTATVTRADTGAILPGTAVTVRVTPRTGAAPKPYAATTDAAGRVAVTLRPTVATDVSVTVPASAGMATATATATVAIAPVATARLDLRLSAASIRAGQDVTFTGTTGAQYAGETVHRQSYYGGAWHTRSKAPVAADGTVRFTVKPLTKSTSKYRLWLAATPAHTAATSKTLTLRVT